MNVIKQLFSSKKFVVVLATNLFMVLTLVVGMEEDQARFLIDHVINLAMAYLGGQSAVDVGKAVTESVMRSKAKPVIDVAVVEKDVTP